MTRTVFILGAGRAGKAIAAALLENNVAVAGIHGRRSIIGAADGFVEPWEATSSGVLPESLSRADTILVTVRDSQIEGAIAELLAASLAPNAVVLHASGSADPVGLAGLRERGHHCGTFHPLIPLTEAALGGRLLRGAWIGIDGDSGAREAAQELIASLQAHVMEIPEGGKGAYHTAAVLASNFPCVLAFLASRLLTGAGVPAEASAAATISLMNASVENLRGHHPRDVLTGPVVRGDVATVHTHIDALSADDDALSVYLALTKVALEMVRESGVAGTPHAEMDAVIEKALFHSYRAE